MLSAVPMPMQRGFALLISVALALAAMVPMVAPMPTRAAANVWINEIHYDNDGTDAGEAIEVAGPAGTDLTGWSIVLYNGNGGASYRTNTLSGVLADQQGGFGTATVTYPTDGIQNGSPDGIALVDAGGVVAQFLSYEGTFAAVGGPANGMTSTDIGVAEVSSTPVGHSLQLTGTGTAYADFTWSAAQPSTFGSVNAGQTFGTGGPVDPPPAEMPRIVISEVYGGGGNPGAALQHDFIELFNQTEEAIDLSGLSLQYAGATGSGNFGANSGLSTELSGTIPPLGYFLVQEAAGTNSAPALPPPDLIDETPINMGGSAGKVALVIGTDSLSCNGGSTPCSDEQLERIVDLIGWGNANFFEGDGPAPATSNSTSAERIETEAGQLQDTDDNVADFRVASPPTPKGSTDVEPPDPCDQEATAIHAIQGSGMTSPSVGSTVTVQGVVVGDFQNNGEPDDGDLGGFYVQEVEADVDSDPATSEGLFVFDSRTDVNVGDLVRVTGRVAEFGSSGSLVTELTSVSQVLVCGSDAALPEPAEVTLPVSDPSDFERYEGMLVTFPQTLTISEFFNFDRFGEIVLTVGRDHQPTAIHEPGSPEAAALAGENRLNRITLDDGRTAQNPDPARHPNGADFTPDNLFRGGDQLDDVTGVIDDSFGLYRVQPTQGATYTAVNPRPIQPKDVGGSLTVASFNVLNYFTTLDDGVNDICGPAQDQECRGADDAEEFERQRAKIVAALATIDADVIGLIEIENHPGDVPTADLVAGLNDAIGPGTYDFVSTGAIGTDAIRVALIYKPGSVTPVGDFAVLDSSVDARFDDAENRPVLAQAFEENATGAVVTVAVNHLKSKGSDCGGPPDDDPEQGNCNLTRTLAARALVDWLAADPTDSGDLDALVIGDLNSYDKEDPIDAVRAGADDLVGTTDDFTDLVLAHEGEEAYSYLFDGQLGYLDHALASPTLAAQVTGATVWHINADEPDLLDYDTQFKADAQDALYEPNAFRSSDHDPVIVGLDLAAFGFGGLTSPITESNTATAGRTVPVKFSLDGDRGLEVLFESARVYDCGDWPGGASVTAVTTDTALRYDPVADQYIFNWQTDSSWVGECKFLVAVLDDGSYATATFEFR